MSQDPAPLVRQDDPHRSLGTLIAKGVAWIAGGGIAMRLLGLINTLILARLLVPEEFGVVAIGVTITQLLQNVSDIGVAQAVVHYRRTGRKILNTLFTLSALRGGAICLLLVGIAGLAGTFYDDQRVTLIFLAMGPIALAQSLINPRFYEFQRQLDFSKEFIVNVTEKVASIVVSIGIAYFYQSYWAIVLGIAAGISTRLLLSYALRPYLPKFSLSAFSTIIHFSGWLAGVSLMAALNNKIDLLILGRLVPKEQTGVYNVGGQLASLPGAELALPVANALYPGLSTLQSTPEKMRETVLRGAEALGVIAIPACVGFAFVAKDLVQVLLGDGWAEAVPLIQWVAAVACLSAVYSGVHGMAMAQGRTRLLFFREFGYFLIRTPIFLWAVISFGFYGAIVAAAGLEVVNNILRAAVYRIVAQDSPVAPLRRVYRSMLALLGMAAYFWLLRPVLPGLDALPALARLLIDSVCGGIAFMATQYALWLAAGKPDSVERIIVKLISGYWQSCQRLVPGARGH